MTPALTQEMVDGADDMAGLLRAPQPAFVFAPSGIKHDRPAKQYRTPGLVTPNSRGIRVTGREQGQADADRNFALRKGSI